MSKTNEIISSIKKNDYIHFYKKIKYNLRNKYKSVEYIYDIFNNDGSIKESKKHNNKKPAVIVYHKNKITTLEYWYKGKRHRNWGPAIINLDGKEIIREEWFNEGIKLTEDEINKIKTVVDRRKKMLKLIFKNRNGRNK